VDGRHLRLAPLDWNLYRLVETCADGLLVTDAATRANVYIP
jgi:hypothetical protein